MHQRDDKDFDGYTSTGIAAELHDDELIKKAPESVSRLRGFLLFSCLKENKKIINNMVKPHGKLVLVS